MRKFTVEEVLDCGPCDRYKKNGGALIKKLFAGRDSITLVDVIDMLDVPDEDVAWIATMLFAPSQNAVFAAMCAMDAGFSAHSAGYAGYAARNAAGYAGYAGAAAGYARELQLCFICEILIMEEK